MTVSTKSGFSHDAQSSTRGTLRIAETFTSRQGEGKLTGVDSFFVRTSGCNLRCWFCDTPYASWNPVGETLSLDQIIDHVTASTLRHVVLTGGEPLLPNEISRLCRRLRDAGFHVTVETAGTIDRYLECDLMSTSPKLASSTPDATEHPAWSHRHQQRRMPIDIMRRLIDRSDDFQVKFVVDSPGDYDELLQVVAGLGIATSDVWVMPQGSTIPAITESATWLAPWTQSQGFHYCDRMQIHW